MRAPIISMEIRWRWMPIFEHRFALRRRAQAYISRAALKLFKLVMSHQALSNHRVKRATADQHIINIARSGYMPIIVSFIAL